MHLHLPGVGDGLHLEKVNEAPLPHSLGLLYEQVTSHLGFLNSSDEYKVMALAVWAQQATDGTSSRWRMDSAYLGPAFDDGQIKVVLDHARLTYQRPVDLTAAVADHLAHGKVIRWFQGRMEFGPRALGGRGILASPTDPRMMHRLNELKDGEDFRPVAPAVLVEEAGRVQRGDGIRAASGLDERQIVLATASKLMKRSSARCPSLGCLRLHDRR